MKKIGLAVGLPVAAIAALILFYPSLSAAASVFTRISETMEESRTFDYEETKQLLHKYVNAERTKNGNKVLEYDNALASVAQGHSEDMATNHFFEHVNLKGQDPSARAAEADYSCRKDYGMYYSEGIAENLVQGGSYFGDFSEDAVAKSSVKSWMESPGHKANILNANYDKEGSGIAEDTMKPGYLYITQNFC